jgi:hypothetical protein
MLVSPFAGGASMRPLTFALVSALAVHLAFITFENVLASSPTRHHELAVAAIRRGPFSRLFWGAAIAGGGLLPLVMLLVTRDGGAPAVAMLAAALALGGSFAWEYIWVEAGQSVPLS